MEEQDKIIELCPGNWLNNASMVGFLFSLQKIENINVNDFLLPDGRVVFPKELFSKLRVEERYFNKETQISSIVAKAPIYRNYLQPSEKELYPLFVKSLTSVTQEGKCSFLTQGYNLPASNVEELKKEGNGGLENFMNRITDYNMIFNADLGPSLSAFPNAYWNLKNSNKVSHLFAFLVIHQYLAFTKLADYSNVFINAPTFQMMYELNRILMEMAGKQNATYRNLLAMSIIEFSIKTNVLLNSWAGMNMEIISIKKDKIEFISIPYNTVKILSNKKVAELIGSIGDFKILNLVIDQKWDELVEIGYRLLKISMNGIGKEDRSFIGQFYTPEDYKTSLSIKNLANKLIKLYSLITERIKY